MSNHLNFFIYGKNFFIDGKWVAPVVPATLDVIDPPPKMPTPRAAG